MLVEKDLVDKEYKKHFPDMFHKYANCVYTKKVKDNNGHTKYFIHYYFYCDMINNIPNSYGVEVQFQRNDEVFNIEIFNGKINHDLNYTESLIEEIWLKMGFALYEEGE